MSCHFVLTEHNKLPSPNSSGQIRNPQFAKFAGYAVVALLLLLARPFLKPWMGTHLGKMPLHDWPWPMWASIFGWVAFSLYWEVAAKTSAPSTNPEPRWPRALHVFMANAALALIFAPVHGLRARVLPASAIAITAGLTLQIMSLLLTVWARQHLGRNWSGEIAIKVDHALVRSGPYGRVRHPIYTALLGMYAGSAIVSGEVHALLGLGLAVFAYVRKIRLEEASLASAFGADYRDYCGATWALLPGLY